MRRKRALRLAVVAASLIGLAATPSARADFIFLPGDHPQPDEQNVLLNNSTFGPQVVGTTDQTGDLVVFFSSSQTLFEPFSGQARIEAIDATGAQVALSDVTDIATPAGPYHDLIFNSFIGDQVGTPGGTEFIQVIDPQGMTHNFSMPLVSGDNFLTIVATNGDSIFALSITYAPGFTDLRQVRISTGVTSIPEPTSIVPAATSSIALLAAYRWRRRRA